MHDAKKNKLQLTPEAVTELRVLLSLATTVTMQVNTERDVVFIGTLADEDRTIRILL